MKSPNNIIKSAGIISWMIYLSAVLVPVSLAAEGPLAEFLRPVGTVPKIDRQIEAFHWEDNKLYVWDEREFQVWDATDLSDIRLMGEDAVGAPVQFGMDNRIHTIGSKPTSTMRTQSGK